MSNTGGETRPSERLREHRAEVLAILRESGVTNPRIFGSVARGTDGVASDIDLLVTVEPGRAWDFVSLPRKLSKMLGVRVDVISDRGLKPKHGDVEKDSVPL